MSDVPDHTPATPGSNPPAAAPSAQAGEAPPTPEVLKAAMKAFKKRLKLTQLDDASRIGRGPMSSGGHSSIAGITPPNQYPRAVWEELANQGKLRRAGHGTYSLGQ
jgi:hypothetical protein